jgi:hypothetical protein
MATNTNITLNSIPHRAMDVCSLGELPLWNYIGVAYPDAVTTVYTFKIGGVSGTTVQTITLVNDAQGRLISATKV